MPHWVHGLVEPARIRPGASPRAMPVSRRVLLSTAVLLLLPGGGAATEIKYIGLHGKRANVRIDQRNVLMAIGESNQGVGVVAASKDGAVLRLDRRNYYFQRGSSRGQLLADELILDRDASGRFAGSGTVNGERVIFVVDTGASHVAISGRDARRLGIRHSRGKRVPFTTASRTETGYEVMLDSVSIGGIVLSNVPALITRGEMPRYPLLGMTFLQNLQIMQDAEHMYLRYE